MLEELVAWLMQQPAKETLSAATWAIPAIQSVHILGLAVILSAMVMMDVRLLSLGGATLPAPELDRRYLRWVWPALVVMVLTGVLMIVAEPDRSLLNPIFQIKMVMLAAAIVLSLVMIRSMGVRSLSQLSAGRRLGVRLMAAGSLILWLSIAVAGRWIAYYTGE